jgi:hypothetical protein
MSKLKRYKSNLLVTFITQIMFIALLLTYIGCDDYLNDADTLNTNTSPGFHSISLLKSSNEKYQQINDAIEDFALIVAHSLQDKELREFYKSEAMRKFDGDFDVLYSNVKDNYVGKESLHSRLSEIANYITRETKLEFKTEFNTIDELTSKIPKLQIAIPVNCEEWNTNNFIPPVACLNSELKNKSVTHVKSYESDGKLTMIEKKITPKHPVVVISINERLDENGNVRECYLEKPEILAKIGYTLTNSIPSVIKSECGDTCPPPDPPPPPPNDTTCYLKFKKIDRLNDDCWKEWLEGAPEFYFEVYKYTNNVKTHINRVYFACGENVKTKTDYDVNLLTINLADRLQYNAIRLELKEEDGGLLGSDDEVETEWTADWINPQPSNNAFPFIEHDFSKWYKGVKRNVNMFAEWMALVPLY